MRRITVMNLRESAYSMFAHHSFKSIYQLFNFLNTLISIYPEPAFTEGSEKPGPYGPLVTGFISLILVAAVSSLVIKVSRERAFLVPWE